MRTTITTDLVRRYTTDPPATEQDIYDAKQPRLVLRVRPNGRHSYRLRLGRGQWYTLGGVDVLTPLLARKQAQKQLGAHADGQDIRAAKRKTRQRTVSEYLTQVYEPWLVTHRRSGAKIAAQLRASYAGTIGGLKLDALTAWHVEQWRRDRLTKGAKPATANRDLGYLRAMLTRACEWGHLGAHPLTKVKALPEDRIGRLRYLSREEESRLRKALETRDETRRTERESANAWRRNRRYDLWPSYGAYTDHLTPLVLLAVNTGLRFGELTGLRWRDVSLEGAMLTVVTEHAKSGRARHVPLNEEAVRVLRAWQSPEATAQAHVFPGSDGARLVDIKSAWMPLLKRAKITAFRFHDLRHTFASKLVMAAVDLNTVRELLGHADIKMVLRYAHLSPEHKAAAVARRVSQ